MDILDKIANFLNIYLRLAHKERRISFNVVWFTNCDPRKEEHPTLGALRQSNVWLECLRDLQDDWFSARYPGPLKELRDAITHRGLVLFSSIAEQATSTRSVDDLERETFLMLRTARAAILYLILMVDSEEGRREATEEGKFHLARALKVGANRKQRL